MFPGSALPHPLAPVSHEPCTLELVSTVPHFLWLANPFLTLSPVALTTSTHKQYRPLPPPLPLAQGEAGYNLSKCSALPLSYSLTKLLVPSASAVQPHFPPKWVDTWLTDPLDATGKVQPHTDVPGDVSQNREMWLGGPTVSRSQKCSVLRKPP